MPQPNDPSPLFLPDRCGRVDRRPSPRFAFQISLGLHSLLVLALLRLYTAHISQPEPTLHIVCRASAVRSAATPSFVTTHVAAAEATEPSIRPSANVEPLPHQSFSTVETSITPLRATQPGLRRTTLPAALPATLPMVSPVVITENGVAESPPAEGAAATPSSRVALERTEALPDMPLRIVMRPVYGRREQRPLGLAELPAVRNDHPVRQPADAFSHRFITERTPLESRAAIDRGLEFLARVQSEDGRWRFDDLRNPAIGFPQPSSLRSDAAATGLALLAFFGAGHDHFDGRYHAVIHDGVEFLVRIQLQGGEFFVEDGAASGRISSFYSHGIASLALCEAYGMTGDARLRLPAQRALDSLLAQLQSESLAASDWSVFGWQLATLRSGRLAGLQIDPESLARFNERLTSSRADAAATDTVSTAVGLAVELHLGNAAGPDRLRPAAEELLAHPPEFGDASDSTPTPKEDPRRDTYYWYYGSQAMYYLGGDNWQAWSKQLYPRLIEMQVSDGPSAGSWEPLAAASGRRTDVATRLYITAMNLLSLETEQRQPTRGAAVPKFDMQVR